MRRYLAIVTLFATVWASTGPAQEKSAADEAAITIYNQQFAVVRHILPLDLKSGVNHVDVTDISTHLEPDSVILRPLDPSQKLQILEQNYRNDPISQQLLLSLYEGQTIDFELPGANGTGGFVKGKIIRSGYVPHYTAMRTYGQQYAYQQQAYMQSGSEQPVIEVDGRLQFSLPGQPLFPKLADDTVLKPTLSWELRSDKAGPTRAEFSYVTGGMNWEADYNVDCASEGQQSGNGGLGDARQPERQNVSQCSYQADGRRREQNPARVRVGWCSAASTVRCVRKLRPLRLLSAVSTSITSTRCKIPPHCMIARPSKWSSCAPMAYSPLRCTFMTA